MTALLETRAVEVAYGDVPVLAGVSLTVEAGEAVAVIGPNGAGKTTLMRTLSGLLRPRKGDVLIGGESTAQWQDYQFARRGVAHVPEGRGMLGELTVEENLELGAYARGGARTGDEFDRVFALFPILRQRLRQQAAMLSGGEQQMLAIGRSLMSRPRLLLVDELSLGLAPKIARELLALLRRFADEGLGILFVEQNVRQMLSIADRIYIVVNGSIVFHGTPQELASQGDVMRLYVGTD